MDAEKQRLLLGRDGHAPEIPEATRNTPRPSIYVDAAMTALKWSLVLGLGANLAWTTFLATPPEQPKHMMYPDCVDGPLAANIVCDMDASPSERAAGLVAAMTMDEKVDNMVNTSPGAPRIGLPPYEWWSEALHGVARSPGVTFNPTGPFSSATSFANPIVLSAAFDDELVHDVAAQIATEARAFSNAGLAGLDWWTPNINPYKDPRWGRGMETPGEDVVRINGYVAALLRGLEGEDRTTRKMIANCKHFAANDLELWEGALRTRFNAEVTLQDLAEYYLPPFRQCVDSDVGSVMCAYNAVSIKGREDVEWNGTPACANGYLMGDVLRGHWGWEGEGRWITSDCNAVLHIWDQHHFTNTRAEAGAAAFIAGTDTACEESNFTTTAARDAWEDGLLDETTVDTALRRLYEGLVLAGYFDGPDAVYRDISWTDVDTPHARTLALRSAAEGLVLTKNDGTLPLNLSGKKVALVGHWVNATTAMLGAYSGIAPYYTNPETAARAMGLDFVTAGGPLNESVADVDTWTVSALDAATEADVVLYFGGIDMSVEVEGRDRYSIVWPGAQAKLVADLASTGKPLVVVQMGDMLDSTDLLANGNISAVVWAGYPGQEGGAAVLDVITGRTAPAGRLPVTQYPGRYVDEVRMTEMELRPVEGRNPGRTYRWYDAEVLPFGFGLHYTTFETALNVGDGGDGTVWKMSDVLAGCQGSRPDLCEFPATVEVSVRNTGKVTSSYTVLVFVRGDFGPTPRPLKTLVAYRKTRDLKPGRTERVGIRVRLGELARRRENGDLVLYPGRYELLLDVDGEMRTGFEIAEDEAVLDAFPQP